MKQIVVGFSRSRGILSWLIRAITHSDVSHAYIRKVSPINTEVVFQASGISVNLESYDHFKTHATVIEEVAIHIPDEDYESGEQFIWKELGKPYSASQLIGYSWVMLCRTVGLRVRNPLSNGTHSYVCVELVARYLGIKDSESLTPQDLYEIVRNQL